MHPTRTEIYASIFVLFAIFLAVNTAFCAVDSPQTLPLGGQWSFSLDNDDKGITGKWYETELSEKVKLPGTTDENQKGTKNEARITEHLSRQYIYEGPAWYQRQIEIPDGWKDKRITLFLERTKQTVVWVDSQQFDGQNSLCAPHVYDLTSAMKPGKHTLTIRVNNDPKLFAIGRSHATLEDTQTNWNGIIGRLELNATDKIWIDDIQLYPDIAKGRIKIHLVINNDTGQDAAGSATIDINKDPAEKENPLKPLTVPFRSNTQSQVVEADYSIGKNSFLWDEFSPSLYNIDIRLDAKTGENHYAGSCNMTVGLRDIRANGTQFSINGKTIFIRGKHDACVFPLTGYSPMDMESWLRVFKIAKSYGINLYRFHSWCPPEAAFEAADKMGMYLQPELPNSTSARLAELTKSAMDQNAFQVTEGERILKSYGNHPSFVMFTLGNELAGDSAMAETVKHFRELDPRHLYAQGSNNSLSTPKQAAGDDFWTTSSTARAGGRVVLSLNPVRGSMAQPYLGHLNNSPPSTTFDYTSALEGINIPVIGHEIGQYEVYPNFNEIGKYTGVLRPISFEIFRERLEEHNMLNQADDFFHASGMLATLCYREDIESALRTPGFGGFHLLDLQDLPGHGTALDGILDSFMDSKGFITPETWREFCSETVPLVLMPKYTWTTGETFTAEVKIAHYGPSTIEQALPHWVLRDAKGDELASDNLPKLNIPNGTLDTLGQISIPLRGVSTPQKLTLEIAIANTKFINHYSIWVYPRKLDFKIPDSLVVSRVYDQSVEAALQKGASVLLLPDLYSLDTNIQGSFITDFCTYPLFKVLDPPGTLGILCNPKHPLFTQFPTEFYSNWQWWQLVKNSRPVILDQTPADFRPLVQVIDNFDRNHKLGLIFEARVGNGKLLFCSIDLLKLQDKPEARQLLYSIVNYVGSKDFAPASQLDSGTIKAFFRNNDHPGNSAAMAPANNSGNSVGTARQ